MAPLLHNTVVTSVYIFISILKFPPNKITTQSRFQGHAFEDSPTERIITLRITSERITSERITSERINTEHITS